jgi:hypothetical protein
MHQRDHFVCLYLKTWRVGFLLFPRSKCHLKQNLIPSWPWSFRHTSCISDFRCKTKYTNKQICRTPGPAYFAVLPFLVIFCSLGPTVRRISKSLSRPILVVYFVLHRKSEMQLVWRNDHGQLGIRFCFKWHLLLKHATVSMVILQKV